MSDLRDLLEDASNSPWEGDDPGELVKIGRRRLRRRFIVRCGGLAAGVAAVLVIGLAVAPGVENPSERGIDPGESLPTPTVTPSKGLGQGSRQ